MSKGTTTCGWCMTGDHENCKPEIKYFEKVWHCSCEKCHKKESDDVSPKKNDGIDQNSNDAGS